MLRVMTQCLRADVESFAHLIESLPAARLEPAAWGPREILAHLAFWHRRYVDLLEAALAARAVDLPRATFKELNAQAVAAARDLTIAQLVANLLAAQADLERLERDARLNTVSIRFKAGSKPWPWPELRRRVGGHFRGHAAVIRRSTASRRASRRLSSSRIPLRSVSAISMRRSER